MRPRATAADDSGAPPRLTVAEMQAIAAARCASSWHDASLKNRATPHQHVTAHPRICRGVTLTLRTLGPAYRIVCRAAAGSGGGAAGEGKVLAVTSGFVAPPLRLMHCDMLQVLTKREPGDGLHSLHGLGLLIGCAVFAHGLSCGCAKAEILAINDDGALQCIYK